MDNLATQWTLDSARSGDATLSASEAARELGLSQRTIRRAIARGDLPAAKIAGVFRIASAELERYRISRRHLPALGKQPRLVEPRLLPVLMPVASAVTDPPRPLTSFIGRQEESAAVVAMLLRKDVQLVTLTGPGGVGKTRLALRVLALLREQHAFRDGCRFVELAPLTDPELVLATIARALGMWESGGRSPQDAIRAHLRGKDLLLVLDNFEHLLPAAPAVVDLFAGCPKLSVLVTSRTLLRVSGERDFPVPPLALPALADGTVPDGLGGADAVQLFVERAQSVKPDFALTAAMAPAVAEICQRLDGVPLAIELAAARSNVLTPQALLARLDHSLSLLTGGPRDAPHRLRSMRDTITWSHDLLTCDERALFRRLAVFAGGFTLAAAEAIGQAGTAPLAEVLALLSALVDGSLVHLEASAEGDPRYGMLETVRDFGLEQLAASGEESAIRPAHASHFLTLAERTAPLLTGPRVRDELAGLERERDNLRAALAWFASCGDGEGLLRLATALSYFWETAGPWTESAVWLERAIAANPEDSAARVKALESLAIIFSYRGDLPRAVGLLREAVELARGMEATEPFALALGTLGAVLVDQGRYAEAEPLLAESIVLARQLADRDIEAVMLTQSGTAAWGRGDRIEAMARLERADQIWSELGNRFSVGLPARQLAELAAECGEFSRAAEWYRLFMAHAPDSALVFARVLPDAASLAAAIGEPARAARLFGAAAELAETVGFVPGWPERGVNERASERTLEALGKAIFEAAFKSGKCLSREQALAEVEQVLEAAAHWPARRQAAGSGRRQDDLTPRERDVLELVAQRLTDREIADQLFVTRRTASKHVASILAKLGVPNRRAAAAEARRLGLV